MAYRGQNIYLRYVSSHGISEVQKLAQLREDDVIIIWKLDRLARSLKDLVGLVNEIPEKVLASQA